MAEEQQIPGALQARDAREQAALRVLVEVDDDVAAEDQIQRPLHGQRMHEVQLLEGDQRGDLRAHLVIPLLALLALAEEAPDALGIEAANAICGIAPAAGALEH